MTDREIVESWEWFGLSSPGLPGKLELEREFCLARGFVRKMVGASMTEYGLKKKRYNPEYQDMGGDRSRGNSRT